MKCYSKWNSAEEKRKRSEKASRAAMARWDAYHATLATSPIPPDPPADMYRLTFENLMTGKTEVITFHPGPRLNSSQELVRTNLEIAIADICKDDYIASVIAKSKYPVELASIALIESNCRPLPRNKSGGDALGMYQVRGRIWGEFGESMPDQTKKAEEVFEKLLYSYGYEKAFERYNGSGRDARAYKKKVMSIRKELLDKVAKLDNNPIKR